MSALARVRAERARRGLGLHDFVESAWPWVDPSPSCFGRYTRTLCWVLEQVLAGRIRRLIINVPPGHMKSLAVSVFWPAWAWLMQPGKRFAFTSYRGDLALRDADRSRDLIRSEFYQELLLGRPHGWNLLRVGQDTKSRFANTEGGYRFSASVSGIMGEGGDVCLRLSSPVLTHDGYRPIVDLLQSGATVLSFDAQTGRWEWQPIEATLYVEKQKILELDTSVGKLYVTPDHRFPTDQGLTRANTLRSGSRLRQFKGRIHGLCETTHAERDLRTMRRGILSATGTPGARQTGRFLFTKMFRPIREGGKQPDRESTENLSGMRAPLQLPRFGSSLLFAPLPEHLVSEEWENIQWRLSRFYADAPACNQAPRWRLPFMRKNKGSFRSPPHQRQQGRRRSGKSGYTLRGLPPDLSRISQAGIGDVIVRNVRELPGREDVACISVKKNHNFVTTGGILTHNCVIDDPHNVEQAESDVVRDETIRKIRLALPTRVRSKDGAIVVIMQRLHERDLTGVLLAEEPNLWTHLCLPARFEKSWINEEGERRGHPTPCRFDWRHDEGDLLFPELFDDTRINELAVGLTEYGVAGQLQQRPHPREGGMFHRADFKFVDAGEVPKGGTRVRGWDLAATASTAPNASTAAWTVGLLVRYVGRKIYIEDVVRLRGSPNKVRTTMRNVGDQDGRSVLIDIPQDPGQAGKAQAQDIVADFPRHRIYYSPESGDKTVRAEAPAAQVEAGNVYLVRAPWNGVFLDEVGAFPGSTFADQVDAFSRAYHRAVRQPKRPTSGSLKGAA